MWTSKQDGEGEESPRELQIYTKAEGSFDVKFIFRKG